MVILERVAARRGFLQGGGEDAELQAELLEELVPPLLDQAAGGDDQHAAGVGPHDELADVEAGHDRLAGPGVVGEDEPQRLAGQHRLVNGRDLVRQRVDVRGMDGHHRVEQEREVDPLGLAGELERGGVAVEGPGAFGRGEGDRRLVGSPEQPLLQGSVGQLVEDLHRAVRDHVDRDDRADQLRLEADEGEAGFSSASCMIDPSRHVRGASTSG